jgi:hypothetical protein
VKIFLMALCTVFVSAAAFAEAPSQETAQVARALVNNSEIVSQLKAGGTTDLADVKITTVKPGVFQYTLVFKRKCECVPSTAVVSILEDVTPTYMDGAIEYKSSVQIKSGY